MSEARAISFLDITAVLPPELSLDMADMANVTENGAGITTVGGQEQQQNMTTEPFNTQGQIPDPV